MSEKMFVNAVRVSGDFSAIFESDGETCYFYLCEISPHNIRRVIDAIHIFSGRPDFVEKEVEVRWSADGKSLDSLSEVSYGPPFKDERNMAEITKVAALQIFQNL